MCNYRDTNKKKENMCDDAMATTVKSLTLAVSSGDLETAQVLLQWLLENAKRNPWPVLDELCRLAVFHGHVDILMMLLKVVDATVNKNNLLRDAVSRGHVDVVRVLLACVDVDPIAVDALRLAAGRGSGDVVRELLLWIGADGRRVDPTIYKNDALRCAVSRGHVDVVRVLLTCVAVGPGDYVFLGIASLYGHVDIVRVLLLWVGVDGKRVDPTAMENYALKCAVNRGHVEVVRVLLSWVGENGKRIDATAMDNYALRCAIAYGHVEVVRVLLAWVGKDEKRVDIEVARRRASTSPDILALCDEVFSIIAWSDSLRAAWISVTAR